MLTKIIAHRGASHEAPENTLPAFQLAYEIGAEGIETDVHLTKDGVPVLMHDEHLKRTTDGIGYIKDYTLEELKIFDAGSWFSDQYAGTKILSLEEFLLWVRHKNLLVNIELKNNKIDYCYIENIICEMVNHFQVQNRTTLSSFNPKSVMRLKQIDPKMEIALLTSKGKRSLINYAKRLGADALHIKYRLVSEKFIKQCQKHKMPVRVYTVNKMAHMQKCFQYGCDGIFTDVPKRGLINRQLYMENKHE
ncbi:glycerophosphodiester phosphodiesterase [Virgibacillus sp. W0181]|uniref:glycerophosphodiester phosphodiesterase n=1 Tax=Virgibacillus sp. W0181 TaxID=3391581 RepID=UPI003F474103